MGTVDEVGGDSKLIQWVVLGEMGGYSKCVCVRGGNVCA